MSFTPPTLAQQIAALGPVSGLPEVLRSALEPGEEFQPVPEPEPSDWLANYPESGQTFERFLSARPSRPSTLRKMLYLQPLEHLEGGGAHPWTSCAGS
jgi:hypothetical protein